MLKIFDKNVLGIEINDSNLVLSLLSRAGRSIKMISQATIALPGDMIKNGRILNKKELLMILENNLAEHASQSKNSRRVIIGLPASLCYFHNFSIQYNRGDELPGLIKKETINNIPAPESDLASTFEIYETKPAHNNLSIAVGMIMAASREIIKDWHELFNDLGFGHIEFEPIALALYRVNFEINNHESACLINHDRYTTDFSVFIGRELAHSFTINVGSENIINELSAQKKISQKEAELILYDSEETVKPLDAGFRLELSEYFHSLIKDIKPDLKYLKHKYGLDIGTFALSGRISEYFIISLNENFAPAKVIKTAVPAKLKGLERKYLPAAGLALKGFDSSQEHKQLSLFWKDNSADKLFLLTMPVSEVIEWLKSKTHRIIIFIAIPALAAIFLSIIVGLIFYNETQPVSKESVYDYSAAVNISLPLIVNPARYAIGSVRGRILRSVINDAVKYSDAKTLAREAAVKKLLPYEALWKDHILISSGASFTVPLASAWIAYQQDDLYHLASEQARQRTKLNNFIINSLEIIAIQKSSSDGIYMIRGKLNILSKTRISPSDL